MSETEKINLTIDGKRITAERGKTILEVATENGIRIPTLCKFPAFPPTGACRVCLVEVEGKPDLLPACITEATDGMVIHTASQRVLKTRRLVVELILSDHKSDCLTCEKNGECELQSLAYELQIETPRWRLSEPRFEIDDSSPVIIIDRNRCILCGRCIYACNDVAVNYCLEIQNRGYASIVAPAFGKPLGESNCKSCGECVRVCPVGAITEKISRFQGRSWELKRTFSTCPYCGVGCGIIIHTRNNRIVKITGNESSPVNAGSLCVKGRFGFDFVHHPDRLTHPLIKRNGEFVRATWEKALDLVAERLARIKRDNGADAIALLSSAKCTNEENYLMQKFARAVIGTNNIDHCARLCHASTVTGLIQAFGSGAMTNSIAEIENAEVIFVTGSNTTEGHPVIGNMIKRAVVHRGAKLIVADPRSIELTRFAAVHLRHRSGTDVALFNGIMHVILKENLHDEEFIHTRTENFEEFAKVLERYTPEYVASITGVPADDIVRAARIYATAQTATILYAMGITQHTTGTDNVLSIANLAMLTGNVGKPSTGVNPLRGQNNVQGACDMGALPNVFPGYQKVTDAEIRTKFERAWGVSLPAEPGLTVVEMMHAAAERKVKAMYIMGENPALSDPDVSHVREALRSLDFLVVQDIFLSETAQLADVVLPATTFAEKDGTYTNTERRVQRIRKAVEPPGEARVDWQILCDVAQRIAPQVKMTYQSADEILDEIASLTPIYGGITSRRLGRLGIQWPCPDESHPGTKFLHEGKFTRGLGKFHAVEFREAAELPDDEFPFILTTGRMLEHWHTGTMSRRCVGLDALQPRAIVEINDKDAENLGVSSGDTIIVESRRGRIEVQALVTPDIRQGTVFIPFHFREAAANLLTIDALDPVAKIPEYKICAVRLRVGVRS